MSLQKKFDTYRKAAGLPPFKLNQNQLAFIEDAPMFLMMTPQERKASWERNPPKAMPAFGQIDEEKWRERRLAQIDLERKKEQRRNAAFTSMAQKSAAKNAEKKKVKAQIGEFGAKMAIGLVKGATRTPGTGAAARFEAMAKYVKANPKATVADVLKHTPYRRDDYNWDLKRGNIKVDVK